MTLISPDTLIQANATLIVGTLVYAKLGKPLVTEERAVWAIRGALSCFGMSMFWLVLVDYFGLLYIPMARALESFSLQ